MSDDSWDISKIEIKFSGSFQCRLATDGDPTDASPKDQSSAAGWTFQYDDQKRLDRIIRLSNPVDLRTALVDPWQDTVVTKLVITEGKWSGAHWIERTGPPLVVVQDVLVGKTVSLGDNVKFDTQAGGGTVGFEALVNFQLNIGRGMFSAAAKLLPVLTGATRDDKATQEYLDKKLTAFSPFAGNMNAARRHLMLGGGGVMEMAGPFGFFCKTNPTPLTHVVMHTSTGVFKDLDTDDFEWFLNLTFSRFDGDTLTGQCEGVVTGT